MHRLWMTTAGPVLSLALSLGVWTSAVMAAEKVLPPDARFTCPMETHPDETDPARQGAYFSAQPGTCPWCGMKLKPIESVGWTRSYHRGEMAQPPAAATTPHSHEHQAAQSQPADDAVPASMRYTCAMERHPDEKDPAARGPYFSATPGKCPRCNMVLKPVENFDWTKPWLAARGAEVGYTCPSHPHVLAHEQDKCPRCGRELEPFKLMYTCPERKHADVISLQPGKCPKDGRPLTPFRGLWLSERMAAANVPPSSQPAADAPYRCPTHPLVHSRSPGACTVCARPLEPMGAAGAVLARTSGSSEATGFLCPMHPEQARSDKPGICPICAMRLVPAARFQPAATAPERVRRELDHMTEHYLEIQRLLASDSTSDLARHALGIAAASETLLKNVAALDLSQAARVESAARRVHEAAMKITGLNIRQDRVQLVDLSAGMVALLEDLRPDRQRWPALYIFHCPMSKGDWIQTSKEKANPYYGFQMLTCGELKGTK